MTGCQSVIGHRFALSSVPFPFSFIIPISLLFSLHLLFLSGSSILSNFLPTCPASLLRTCLNHSNLVSLISQAIRLTWAVLLIDSFLILPIHISPNICNSAYSSSHFFVSVVDSKPYGISGLIAVVRFSSRFADDLRY